jgi:hypothetical protein
MAPPFLSTSSVIDLPEGVRPDVAAVLRWYERALVAQGITVSPPEEGELEFTCPGGLTPAPPGTPTLTAVAGGELTVVPTDSGLTVHLAFAPDTTVPVVGGLLATSLVVLGFGALEGSIVGGLTATAALSIWLLAMHRARKFLSSTNADIVASYLANPARHMPPEPLPPN